MNTYIPLIETVALNDKGTKETRYYVYNTVSKTRHSEWKNYTDCRRAAADLNRMLKQAGTDLAKDY